MWFCTFIIYQKADRYEHLLARVCKYAHLHVRTFLTVEQMMRESIVFGEGQMNRESIWGERLEAYGKLSE